MNKTDSTDKQPPRDLEVVTSTETLGTEEATWVQFKRYIHFYQRFTFHLKKGQLSG